EGFGSSGVFVLESQADRPRGLLGAVAVSGGELPGRGLGRPREPGAGTDDGRVDALELDPQHDLRSVTTRNPRIHIACYEDAVVASLRAEPDVAVAGSGPLKDSDLVRVRAATRDAAKHKRIAVCARRRVSAERHRDLRQY